LELKTIGGGSLLEKGGGGVGFRNLEELGGEGVAQKPFTFFTGSRESREGGNRGMKINPKKKKLDIAKTGAPETQGTNLESGTC